VSSPCSHWAGSMDLAVGRKVHCAVCNCCFWICQSCWRGQKYCSVSCSKQGRLIQRRASQKNYARSPEVRQDRKEYQQNYRIKKSDLIKKNSQKVGVTDHTSPSLVLRVDPAQLNLAEPYFDLNRPFFGHPSPCCSVCGVQLSVNELRKEKKR
jgi:hypothetical protein